MAVKLTERMRSEIRSSKRFASVDRSGKPVADRQENRWILEEHNGMTDVTINVEAEPGVTGHTVAKHLRERLGFLPKGDVFPVGALPRTEGKAKRVIRKKVD